MLNLTKSYIWEKFGQPGTGSNEPMNNIHQLLQKQINWKLTKKSIENSTQITPFIFFFLTSNARPNRYLPYDPLYKTWTNEQHLDMEHLLRLIWIKIILWEQEQTDCFRKNIKKMDYMNKKFLQYELKKRMRSHTLCMHMSYFLHIILS